MSRRNKPKWKWFNNFSASLAAGLVVGFIILLIGALVLPQYITQNLTPHPVISIEEMVYGNVTTLFITNIGTVPMSYLSLQLYTPGIIDYHLRKFNSINFSIFGGNETNGINIEARNILPGDAGYVDIIFPKPTQVVFQSISSDAYSGKFELLNLSNNHGVGDLIVCNKGACQIVNQS